MIRQVKYYVRNSLERGREVSSTTTGRGDKPEVVLWADEDGALIEYSQEGYDRMGHLYYRNENLALVKRPDVVINDYSIF